MKVFEFFDKFTTPEDRREFIVNLIKDVITDTWLNIDDDQRCRDVVYFQSSEYSRGICINPEAKRIEVFVPIFRFQVLGHLDDDEGEPFYANLELNSDHELDHLPMIISYLLDTGVISSLA